MRPTQFVTQCVINREVSVKQTHITQIALVKSFAEFFRQAFCKITKNSFAVFRPPILQLVLGNHFANLPIGSYHRKIDRFVSRLPGRLQDLFY